MNRREVIAAVAGAGFTLPLLAGGASAQQPAKVYRLSLVAQSDDKNWRTDPYGVTFLDELRRRGYEEGRNLLIERSSKEGRSDAELARDTVRSQPDVILTWDSRMAVHLKEATSTIPIVAMTADPVAHGLAQSLARPGGNVTGLSLQLEVAGKYLDLLRELNPRMSKVGYLTSASGWEAVFVRNLRELASRAGISLLGPAVDSPLDENEYRRVLAEMARQHADAVIVGNVPENYIRQRLIVSALAQARLPALYQVADYTRLGGLMAYTTDTHDLFRRAADYIDRILKGANPAEMPFQENTKYYLVLNLKTASNLGITFPPTLLARADEVIE